ncbi:MAG: hypothetical protein VXV96_07260 [Bdellovibrionota bacterium]|nr:hypothetical protein [Bdellovibrionota bacterium]
MIKTLLLSFFTLKSFAGVGIVTTLEAPIVRSLEVDSPTVMTKRKGEKIYIHDRYFKNGPNEIIFVQDDETKEASFSQMENDEGYEKFYETIDKNGQKAYISRYYVKLITHDAREFTQNITPFVPDPNDYRLEEPLPEGYPMRKPEMGRARVSFSFGPDLKSNYNYNSVLTEEDFSNRYGFEISFGKKANWDNEDRFYFGGIFQGWTSEARFKLFDDRTTRETRSQLSLGPYISYDPWRNKDFKLTLETALLISYTRNLVNQADDFGFEEERLFSGIGVHPRFSSFIQMNTKVQDLKVIAGFDVQFYLPQSLTNKSEPISDYWNEVATDEDNINIPFSAHYALFLGIQTDY